MSLTEKEIKEIKSQLVSQIKNLPEDKRKEAQKQIDSLSSEALEAMVEEQKQRSQQSIFRLIVSEQVESVKIGENSNAIAVLDISPISNGHSIIIPKHSVATEKDLPKEAFELASELSNKIISNLKAKEVKTIPSTQFGESVLHLIPIYDSPLTLDSPRSKSSPEDLKNIKSSLETIKIEKKVEKIKKNKPRGRKPSPIKMKRKIP